MRRTTEEGMRFIARTKGGYYISVDVTETEMIASLHGLIIMIKGEYLDRTDGHYRIYNKLENTYAKLDVGPDDVSSWSTRSGLEQVKL